MAKHRTRQGLRWPLADAEKDTSDDDLLDLVERARQDSGFVRERH